MKLFLSKNEKERRKIQLAMTDEMWRQVEVIEAEHTLLEISQDTQIEDLTEIIKILQPKPTPTSMLKSLYSSITSWIFSLIINKRFRLIAPTEEILVRREICRNCPFQQKRLFTTTCSQCGCIIRLKTKIVTESCPLNKW